MSTAREVRFVVPDGIDDDTAPSGGNIYDRRVILGLPAEGWTVRELPVAGAWPRPDIPARARLAEILHTVPDRAVVLIDGLVACGVPEVLAPHARRLAMVVLVHLPLGDERSGCGASIGTERNCCVASVGEWSGGGASIGTERNCCVASVGEWSGGGASIVGAVGPESVDTGLAVLERQALQVAHAIVTTSEWTAGRLVAGHGLPAERITVAPPGVDPAPLAAGMDGANSLLCVGSITPTKGQDLLVDALAALARHGIGDGRAAGPDSSVPGKVSGGLVGGAPRRLTDGESGALDLERYVTSQVSWTCTLVGSLTRAPAHVTAVRSAIERHGLGGRVWLTGPLTGAPLAEAYARADLLVLPSRAEAFGMVVTEALTRGIPVLAADVGGVRAALGHDPGGGEPGILVPPDDSAALAAALRRWLCGPVLRERLRRSARNRIATLDGWEVTSRCLATVLDRVRRKALTAG